MRYILDSNLNVIAVVPVPVVCRNGTEVKQADRRLLEKALELDTKK
jgi:hypothetical protein